MLNQTHKGQRLTNRYNALLAAGATQATHHTAGRCMQAKRKDTAKMKLEEYKHINALNKLLGKIRYGDKLDSDDIDFFATSPLIVDIHKMVSEEWIKLSKDKGYLSDSDIEKIFFEFESYTGQMFRNRIDNWDNQMIETIRKWNQKQIDEYAILMIAPLNYNESELKKLTDYITNRLG